MDDWLPGYEQIPITGCTGPGTYVDGTAWKAVLHTTESGAGSSQGVVRLFQGQTCSCPHFIIDPSDGRKIQCIPMSWSAAALRGGRNGYQTNRARAIQVEIIGRAQETHDWPDEWLAFVGEWLADIIRAGAPIDLDNVADFNVHGTVAVEGSPYRMSPDAFHAFDGVCGHIHVPFNDHYDPFTIDIGKVIGFAKASLAGGGYVPPAPGPAPAPIDPVSPYGDGYFGMGATGGIVTFLQELLAGLGYDLGPSGADGDFGPATDAAVRAFQADHGLDADGLWGPASMAAMAAAYQAPPPGSDPEHQAPDVATTPAFPGRAFGVGDSGDDVRQWQQRMADRGWTIGVDGIFGPESENVCRQFQAEKGLDVDGIVGPNTWAASWTAPVT